MKLKYQFVVQEVSDGFVAVAVGSDATKFSGIIRMNKTSAYIFEQLREEITMVELMRRLTRRYDADEKVLRENAERFISKLRSESLLLD